MKKLSLNTVTLATRANAVIAQNFAFIHVTGFGIVTPVSMNTLQKIHVDLSLKSYIMSTEYPWSFYTVLTYINEEGLKEISYQYCTFKGSYVSLKDAEEVLQKAKNAFIDSEEHKNLIRVVWIGAPYQQNLSESTLMKIAEITGAFTPRGNKNA